MKICRFNEGRIGIVRGDRIYDVTQVAESMRRAGAGDCSPLGALRALQAMYPSDIEDRESFSVAAVRLLAPVAAPGKIVAAPLNYRAHIQEMVAAGALTGTDPPTIDVAGLFLKASSSLAGPAEGIRLRFPQRRTDHEIELVAIIGRTAADVAIADALQCVAGYCVGLDITLRGREDRSFRKSIDTYSVIGPWMTTADEVPDPQALQLVLRKNGVVCQDASTSDMVYDVARLIAYASSFYTLHPGDLIFTGTPQGVAPIHDGDELFAGCAQLGTMRVVVSAHRADAAACVYRTLRADIVLTIARLVKLQYRTTSAKNAHRRTNGPNR